MNFENVSNEELLLGLRALVAQGHQVLAHLLAYLGEVEERRLDLESACSSLFDFCVRRLGMSEDEACRRVGAARLVRKFPIAFAMIERGQIHLTALLLLGRHLTEGNHEEVLQAATHKTKSEVEHLIAERFPRPDVPVLVQPLRPLAFTPGSPQAVVGSMATVIAAPEPRAPRMEPLAPERYRVQFTASAELKQKMERAANLMRHANLAGDLSVLMERAVDLLIAKLEKQRLAKTAQPSKQRAVEIAHPQEQGLGETAQPQKQPDIKSAQIEERRLGEVAGPCLTPGKTPSNCKTPFKRTGRGGVPRAVRREVFERDGEQCTFVDSTGRRCESRSLLELDHVRARALGGTDHADNLAVRCRSHNALSAERDFGRDCIERKKNERRSTSHSRPPRQHRHEDDPRQRGSQDVTTLRALRGLGFKDAEARHALEVVAERWASRPPPPIETRLRDALSVLA
ncbi:MAG TPA: HNH endonuclease signature motif containing protein [Polyangiaceae bacterium]|jgi:5-methylcytosine-specific restriction endonuclease McrA|nr:HNH endonuclease signature motif containing protein [Polyangiaceae bacterium]